MALTPIPQSTDSSSAELSARLHQTSATGTQFVLWVRAAECAGIQPISSYLPGIRSRPCLIDFSFQASCSDLLPGDIMGISVRRSVSRRVASAALGCVLLGGGSGACGTGGASSSGKSAQPSASALTPTEAVAKAAEDSADITSLRYRITGSVPDRGRLTVDAAMHTAPLSMTMELTMPDQRAKGPLSIRFAGKAMYVGGGALDIRKLGRSAKLDPDKLNGKSWIRIEPAAWGLISVVDKRSYGLLPHQVGGSPIAQSTLLTGAKNTKAATASGGSGASDLCSGTRCACLRDLMDWGDEDLVASCPAGS